MKKVRIIVDVLMYIIFIILMGHHTTSNFIHEVLGTILFILFIVHHVLNYRWYKTMFKGKYKVKRVLTLLIDLLLLISMIGMIVSAFIISSDVFYFLNIPTSIFGRRLHMLSTSWGFIFMSIHLGMHLNLLLNKINRKMKNSNFEYVYYLILLFLCGFGIYSFIELDFISDMFLLNAFKYYDFSELVIVFYLKVLSSSLLIALIIYFISHLKKEGRKK